MVYEIRFSRLRFELWPNHQLESHIRPTLRYNFARHETWAQRGDVLELADRHDLGSCAERREGSIPSVPTFTFCHCEEPRSGDEAISSQKGRLLRPLGSQ